MKRLALSLTGFGLVLLTLTNADPARAAIRDVALIDATPTYTGPCPVTLTFTVAMDGDPGTIFSHQLIGDGPPSTKLGYGFVPTSGSISFDVQVTVDEAHAGEHRIWAAIKYGDKPGALSNSLESDHVAYTVTCGAVPGPSPTASSTPTATPQMTLPPCDGGMSIVQLAIPVDPKSRITSVSRIVDQLCR